MTINNKDSNSIIHLQSLTKDSVIWIVALILAISISTVLVINFNSNSNLSEGEPASENILAPYSYSYTSRVLTQQQETQTANSIPSVYTPIDRSIGRYQSNNAQVIFNYIDVVLADPLADFQTKIYYLEAIDNINVEKQIAENIINFKNHEFETVKRDILRIIEDIMRQEIRETNLSNFRRQARMETSLSLTTVEENVVTSLVSQFIVANTFLDELATEQKRAEAIARVEPVIVTWSKGQPILGVGDIIDSADIETLKAFGLLEQPTNLQYLFSTFTVVLLSTILVVTYWQQFHGQSHVISHQLILFCILIFIFTVSAKIMIPNRSNYNAYLFPATTMAMLLAVLFDVRLSMIVTIVTGIIVGYIAVDSLELAVYTMMGSLLAILSLRDAQQITAFFRAGTFAALANVAVIIVFHLPVEVEALEVLRLIGLAVFNGFISAGFALAALYFLDNVFGLTTTVLHLQELSRLDHPLLKELLRKAPGTYHHSIMVANLAEQAAEKVGASGTLVRVGAFYHDIGKMNRPPFFTENQAGINPHDKLDPYSSTRIIINHVIEGIELGKEHKLPKRILDFIIEHHGQSTVRAFYAKALANMENDDTKVDKSRFQYPGPIPRSKETGIVLLADSIDAASNALRPNTETAIEKLVNNIMDHYLQDGQLDNSGLTLGDIKSIRESFIETLQGRFHIRVKYPENKDLMEPTQTQTDVQSKIRPLLGHRPVVAN